MTPGPLWERIHEVFGRAVELPPADRLPFARSACNDDPDLLRRVEELLGAHAALEAAPPTDPALREELDATLAAALLDRDSGELAPGDTIGRYRVLREAGRGGMGVVYLAHDPRLNRPVALKVLPRWRTTDPSANRRLEEEARAASSLDHPHIATVYEIGESAEGRLFIAMGWYEGGTLRDRLRDAPLPVDAVVGIARQLADGLAAAHARGIVHRDVKPENVAFGRGGRALILDFGLASPSGQTPGGGTPGTAAYMSPEQARGERVDHRSDLWALGVVLYEMLTARRPFEGPPTGPREAPPPLPMGTPAPLAEVIRQCLQSDPERRYRSAGEVLDALDTGLPTVQRPAPLRVAPVAGAYVVAATAVFLGALEVAARYHLPEWFGPSVLALLAVGFLVTAATAALHVPWEGAPSGRLLTWRRTFGGGALALCGMAALGAGVVAGGFPRVTDARGSASGALEARPWVVLADFEASEGVADVALAAREALAVDLSQSGHVNVYGRGQVAGVLARMGHPAAALDLPLAMEVAERGGAGAVLAGSVTRVGRAFVLTGRAYDPRSGEVLFAVRTAAGEDRLLGAVERLSREMRRRLGEDPGRIRQSRPLPDVTTPSLEALRLYAAAEERHAHLDFEQAAALLEEALRLDPGFAMAHRLAAAASVSRLSYGGSAHHNRLAYELRDRLPERERLHVEAAFNITAAFEPVQALQTYRLLLSRYPGDVRAWNNLGSTLHTWMGDTEGAFAAYQRALELDPHVGFALANAAYMAAIAGRLDAADQLAQRAVDAGMSAFGPRWKVVREFAFGDVGAALALCDSLLAAPRPPWGAAEDGEVCGSLDVAAGRLRPGIARLEAVTEAYIDRGRYRNVAHAAHSLAVADVLLGEPARAADRLAAVVDRIPAEGFIEPDRYITRTNLRIHAALLGRPDVADRVARAYPPYPDPSHWFGRFAESLVDAAGAVAAGDGEGALRALDVGRRDGTLPIGLRVWDALLRGLAHEARGDLPSAAAHLRAAAEPGYLLPPYLAKERALLPLALEHLARVEEGQEATEATGANRLNRLLALADPEVLRFPR
jgi:hypothetical protein